LFSCSLFCSISPLYSVIFLPSVSLFLIVSIPLCFSFPSFLFYSDCAPQFSKQPPSVFHSSVKPPLFPCGSFFFFYSSSFLLLSMFSFFLFSSNPPSVFSFFSSLISLYPPPVFFSFLPPLFCSLPPYL
jgi:hypothetical protein